MKVYLDNCAYNRPFDDKEQLTIEMEAAAKLHIQDEIRSGKYDLVWSYMNEYENNDNPYEDKREAIKKILLILFAKWKQKMQAVIKSDTVLRVEAMKILMEAIGSINTDRFINSIKADHFDYTKWQENLWKNESIEEIHQKASASYKAAHGE